MILLDKWGCPYEEDTLTIPGMNGLSGPVIPPLPAGTNEARSPDWPRFLHDLLRGSPLCVGCGRKAVTGHHKVPFGVDKKLELVASNIALVCLPCHFVICHDGNWHTYDPECASSLIAHLSRVHRALKI